MPAAVQQGTTTSLSELRDQLALLDAECINVLARRLALARRIGDVKRTHGLPTLDARREAQVVSSAAVLGREAGLPEEEVRGIFWQVVAMSRRVQQDDAP